MNYYEFLLPNTNMGQRAFKRVFLLIALFHFVTGLVFGVIALCINWRFVFLPLTWFLVGFVYGNIAYIFVTDYKYIYDNGTFAIYKHRRFGKYRLVVQAPSVDIDWSQGAPFVKQKHCTNCPLNLTFVYQGILYIVTVDDYMLSLLRGETNDVS